MLCVIRVLSAQGIQLFLAAHASSGIFLPLSGSFWWSLYMCPLLSNPWEAGGTLCYGSCPVTHGPADPSYLDLCLLSPWRPLGSVQTPPPRLPPGNPLQKERRALRVHLIYTPSLRGHRSSLPTAKCLKTTILYILSSVRVV